MTTTDGPVTRGAPASGRTSAMGLKVEVDAVGCGVPASFSSAAGRAKRERSDQQARDGSQPCQTNPQPPARGMSVRNLAAVVNVPCLHRSHIYTEKFQVYTRERRGPGAADWLPNCLDMSTQASGASKGPVAEQGRDHIDCRADGSVEETPNDSLTQESLSGASSCVPVRILGLWGSTNGVIGTRYDLYATTSGRPVGCQECHQIADAVDVRSQLNGSVSPARRREGRRQRDGSRVGRCRQSSLPRAKVVGFATGSAAPSACGKWVACLWWNTSWRPSLRVASAML